MKNVLKNKLFLTTFASDMLSNFGDTLYYMALMNYILLLPNNQIAISAVTLSETLPRLFSFAIGIKADKTANKLTLIIWSLVFRLGLYSILGILIGFEPSLWIVLVAAGINFVSDLAGQYENGLYSPIALRIVQPEDRQATAGFRQSVAAILRIIFQSSGALLIGIMTYQQLAFFNAATFGLVAMIMLMIKPTLNSLLQADPIKQIEQPQEKKNFLLDMWESSKLVIREIRQIPELKAVMTVVPMINAIFAGLDVLFVFAASQNPSLLIVNLPLTLTAISIAALLGNILGGVLSMTVAKNWDIVTVIRYSTVFPVLIFAAFLLENTYLAIVVMFLTMLVIGAVNPKFHALIMNSLPEERLATIGSGIDTYFTAGILLVRFLLSALILVLAPIPLLLVFLVAAIVVMIWTFLGNSRADKV